MIPIVTATAVGNWREVENTFSESRIPFKRLSDLSGKTALDVLLKLKSQLLITDNDLMNIDRAFLFSGQYLHIPIMVIRETKSTLDTKMNFLCASAKIWSLVIK